MDHISAMMTELTTLSVCIRLAMSILFAGFIGIERQGHRHPAGLRTHILVCVGSAMTMMLGQYLFNMYGSDPSRIGAQVVSGIGFLGVGTIIMNRGHVRGITTAAGLWASACLGLAIGAGFYTGAVIGFIAIAFALIVMRKMSEIYYNRHPRRKYLYVQLRTLPDLQYISKLLKAWGVTVNHTEIDNSEETTDDYEKCFSASLDITMKGTTDSNIVMANLLQEDCVIYADYMKKQE